MDRDPFDLIGDVIEGQFRVDSLAGEGDVSVVYRGHHLGVDAPVAIKFLNLPATLDPDLVRPLVDAFKQASRIHYRLARGTHAVAQSLASGTTLLPRNGVVVPYLVREWLEGESLASDLAHRRDQRKGGRSVGDAVALLETAFEGVAHAHLQGDSHLAINPSNLFLARRGDTVSIKVLDFGIAGTTKDIVIGGEARPEGGLRVLLPAYAAPEQLDQSVGKPGPWTDVYALALVTMEVLSGRRVMAEQETGALVARALDPNRRPSPRCHGLSLPRDVDLVLTRAVSRAPDRRQENAGALWRAIESAVRGTTSRPAVAAAPAHKPTRLVRVSKPPLSTGAESPSPGGSVSDAGTAAGMGVSSFAVGKVRQSATPYMETLPMAFEPSLPLTRAGVTGTEPVQVFPAAMATPESDSSIAVLATSTPPTPAAGLSFETAPPLLRQPSRRLVVTVGSLVGASLLVVALLGSIWRRHPTGEGTAAATGLSVAPPAFDVPVAPAAPEVPATGSAPVSVLPSPEPVALPSAAAQTPASPFMPFAAKRALDATSRDVLGCRRDKTWGVAQAKVTFASDGSVSRVAVGAPFAGTQTGACVADELSAARVAPFAGKGGLVVYQFFVAAR